MRILQNIAGGLMIFIGLVSFLIGSIISGITCLIFGIVLIPAFLDKILKKSKYKIKSTGKILIRIISFIVFMVAVSAEEAAEEKQRLEAISSVTSYFDEAEKISYGSSKQNTQNQLKYIDSIYSANEASLGEREKQLQSEIQQITSEEKLLTFIDSLSEVEYDNLLKGELNRKFLKDEKLNQILLSEIGQLAKSENDFSSKKEYLAYRAKRAYKASDFQSFESYLSKAVKLKDDYTIEDDLFFELAKQHKNDENLKGVSDAYEMGLKNNPASKDFLENLGNQKINEEKYSQAIKYYKQYLKIDNANASVYTYLGYAYEMSRNKSQAKLNYKSAINLEGNGGDACKRLRELTVKVVGYNYSSRCCDGSSSGATGRGACSHHGGVCGTIKTPITRYTMNCN